MRLGRVIAGVVLSVTAISAWAQDEGLDNSLGKVQNVYVREANGLYYEQKLLRRSAGKELWAEIRFAGKVEDGPSTAMAKLSPYALIERGDVVIVRTGEAMADGMPLLPDTTHVEGVFAKRGTVQALQFDVPTSAGSNIVGLETRP